MCFIFLNINPIPVIKIGINDVYGESGSAVELLEKYGLNSEGIYKQIKSNL